MKLKRYMSMEELSAMGAGNGAGIVDPVPVDSISDEELTDNHEVIQEAHDDLVALIDELAKLHNGVGESIGVRSNTESSVSTESFLLARQYKRRVTATFERMGLDAKRFVVGMESITPGNVSTEGLGEFITRAIKKIIEAHRKAAFAIREAFSKLFIGFKGIRARCVELLGKINTIHNHETEGRKFSANGFHRLAYKGKSDRESVLAGLVATKTLVDHTEQHYLPACVVFYRDITDAYKGANRKINEYIAHTPGGTGGGASSGGGNTTIIIGSGNTVDNSAKGSSGRGDDSVGSRRSQAMWRVLSEDLKDVYVKGLSNIKSNADTSIEGSNGWGLGVNRSGFIVVSRRKHPSVPVRQEHNAWELNDIAKMLQDTISIIDSIDHSRLEQTYDEYDQCEEAAGQALEHIFGELYDDAIARRDRAQGRIYDKTANGESPDRADVAERDEAQRAIDRFEEVYDYVTYEPLWGIYKFYQNLYSVVRASTMVGAAALR